MVTIRKGSRTLTVPLGAYRNVYASAGWEVAGAENTKVEEPVAETKPEEPVVEATEDEDDFDDFVNEEEEDGEVTAEELLEKPLEELNFEELKVVAEHLGIDTKGMKSSKPIREAIKKSRKR